MTRWRKWLYFLVALALALVLRDEAHADSSTVQFQTVQQAITNIQTQLNSLQSQITKIGTPVNVPSTPSHDLLITAGGSFTLLNMPLDTFLFGEGAAADPIALALPNCADSTHAWSYSTSGHALTCPVVFNNQGTTTTVLHGNAAGNPSFGAVNLTTDVGGSLPIANITAVTPPGGRLTLTTATPVMTADATAQGTIFYDTYSSNTVPVAGAYLTIGSNEISLILDATNQLSGKLYDVFAINVSGTLTLCAGPAWTNSTTRSQAIALSAGIWTNSGSMTHCFNNAVDKGPISGNAGTYLGTFDATANGQTGMQFHPAAAAGGANAVLGVYNAYNRVALSSTSLDNTSTWTYATATWRAADNNNSNRVSYVDGLAQSVVSCTYGVLETGSNGAETGCDLNSTSATPAVIAYNQSASGGFNNSTVDFAPTLGLNFGQAMEYSAAGATITYYGTGASGGFQSQWLRVQLLM